MTIDAGRRLGDALKQRSQQGLTLYLQGQLGAGKTTFVRGLLRAFDYFGKVKSPTYTLVEVYELAMPICHFDLYRLGDPEELAYMGIRDYFYSQSLCLIEWPQRGLGFLPEADIIVDLSPQCASDTTALGRELVISSTAPTIHDLLSLTNDDVA
ncbi:MAG: tRNA (adenosine(37)-N6)-threonylcarbamoyltransferase complex ATPase subunit type 1 TsaE [Cellvibrionaceae bacterium]|nr:tRNA (adenosine(37)-N6)-threonylcarbamoyltransferase complex ATPase subunit type 1 TsaE [Cellvibrionaceae bacterium]